MYGSKAQFAPAPVGKSSGTAYALWFFLGIFGAHQFYLGKTARAIGYLLTFAWFTVAWWVDLFTLATQVKQVNGKNYVETRWQQTGGI